MHDRRERFRAILSGDRFVRPASVYDALSARAAEALGYELMMMAGSTASLAVLGAPDIVLLTLTEFAEQARRVTRAASLPLMVDAFISVEEGAGKMRAAVAARTDPSLAILARTGAIRGEGIESARSRAKAYEAAGVDALFFVGQPSRADLEALRSATTLPFILGGSTADLGDGPYLESQGVRIGGWSHRPIQAATEAAYATLRSLRQDETAELPPAFAPGNVVETLSWKRAYDEDVERFMR